MTARAATIVPAQARRPASLRRSVASVIALLSLLPNLLLLVVVVMPAVRDQPDLARTLLPGVAAWFAFVAAFSALVGFVLATALLRPLTQLRDEVHALGEDATRLESLRLDEPTSEPAEVARVRAGLRALLTGLRAEQGKRAAFMATLVHDLKTPILAANHVLQVVRDESALPREDRVQLVASVLDENRRLLELVQRMVDAHRFEREDVTLELAPLDLGAAARSVAERFQGAAKTHGVRLEAAGEGRALAAAGELERALSNLVDNALRYASSTVTVQADGSTVTVRDDGPGLPAPLARLVEPFGSQQVELAGRRYTAGTGGLGLFIASQVALAHGGTLESEVAEGGACLRLRLQPA